ncbi:melanoma-associated antigen 11-like [Otolemur garnettii]|nr:melanoma-associated antigen 11-like [Otolemur garnettii]
MSDHQDQQNQGLQAQREVQNPRAQEEEAAASFSAGIPGPLEEGAAAAGASPASGEGHQPDEGSSSQGAEGPAPPQELEDPEVLRDALEDKMSDLIHLMLLKYRIKEPITKEEMMSSVVQQYGDHFAEIFREATDCLELVFGIDVKEVDPPSNCYILVTSMGLSYHEELDDENCLPKVGLLIIILGFIFLEGNSAPEEVIWAALGMMGVHDGWEHFIYGEPRQLITHHWVQEGYLVYQQVPQSDPARYEFLWGPRAHAETTKMKVLEYVAKINKRDPRSFPYLYEEALRDEEEEE